MQVETRFSFNGGSDHVNAVCSQKAINTDQALSFVTFNTEGLRSVCNELDLASFVLKYDFVLLVETFTKTVPNSMLPSHKPFVSPGVKVSDSIHGRLSGGIVLLEKSYVSMLSG